MQTRLRCITKALRSPLWDTYMSNASPGKRGPFHESSVSNCNHPAKDAGIGGVFPKHTDRASR